MSLSPRCSVSCQDVSVVLLYIVFGHVSRILSRKQLGEGRFFAWKGQPFVTGEEKALNIAQKETILISLHKT